MTTVNVKAIQFWIITICLGWTDAFLQSFTGGTSPGAVAGFGFPGFSSGNAPTDDTAGRAIGGAISAFQGVGEGIGSVFAAPVSSALQGVQNPPGWQTGAGVQNQPGLQNPPGWQTGPGLQNRQGGHHQPGFQNRPGGARGDNRPAGGNKPVGGVRKINNGPNYKPVTASDKPTAFRQSPAFVANLKPTPNPFADMSFEDFLKFQEYLQMSGGGSIPPPTTSRPPTPLHDGPMTFEEYFRLNAPTTSRPTPPWPIRRPTQRPETPPMSFEEYLRRMQGEPTTTTPLPIPMDFRMYQEYLKKMQGGAAEPETTTPEPTTTEHPEMSMDFRMFQEYLRKMQEGAATEPEEPETTTTPEPTTTELPTDETNAVPMMDFEMFQEYLRKMQGGDEPESTTPEPTTTPIPTTTDAPSTTPDMAYLMFQEYLKSMQGEETTTAAPETTTEVSLEIPALDDLPDYEEFLKYKDFFAI